MISRIQLVETMWFDVNESQNEQICHSAIVHVLQRMIKLNKAL